MDSFCHWFYWDGTGMVPPAPAPCPCHFEPHLHGEGSLSRSSRPCDEVSKGQGWKGEISGCGGQGGRGSGGRGERSASAGHRGCARPRAVCPPPPGGGWGGAVPKARGLTATSPLAELLPHLGGLQLEGHQAALPAQVSGQQGDNGGGTVPDLSPPNQGVTPVSLPPPGPQCWPRSPSWTPSRKWPTWPPTPEVGPGGGHGGLVVRGGSQHHVPFPPHPGPGLPLRRRHWAAKQMVPAAPRPSGAAGEEEEEEEKEEEEEEEEGLSHNQICLPAPSSGIRASRGSGAAPDARVEVAGGHGAAWGADGEEGAEGCPHGPRCGTRAGFRCFTWGFLGCGEAAPRCPAHGQGFLTALCGICGAAPLWPPLGFRVNGCLPAKRGRLLCRAPKCTAQGAPQWLSMYAFNRGVGGAPRPRWPPPTLSGPRSDPQGPRGTSAPRSPACACGTAASRPSSGSSPSRCRGGELGTPLGASPGIFPTPQRGGGGVGPAPTSRFAPPLQRPHGEPDHPPAGQDRGLEESRQPAGQGPRQRWGGTFWGRGGCFLGCGGDAWSHPAPVPAEYKRARHEIKKKSSDTLKLQKKARKGKGDLQPQLDTALQDVNDMYLLLEETEKQAVRRALIEERGRFCTFIAFLQPVVNGELTMLGEITHLQGIIDDLAVLTAEPHKLPPASEQVIKDLKGSDYSWSYQTPPSSPSSSSSRKSSMCSSVSSAKGGLPWPGGAQTCSPSSTYRYRSLAQPASAGTRLSSVSSHDSGFISQDAAYSKPPSPMPSDITSQKSSSSASSEASETCQSVSECSSPTSDWSKASPYDQPAVSTLQRRKDRVEHLREAEVGSATGAYPGMGAEDTPRPRMSPATIAAKHGEEVSPAASDLAMVLTRGLSLEHQKSSRDSLQYSSGYSTQTTTPSCSEDTIPSQGSDYDCYSVNGDVECEPQSDFDKSSTIPRNSNIAQNYRRMIQTKRPASTAGLPSGTSLPAGTTPGVATIRRTPSTKPSVRRTLSNAGPIPIRPPIVPVKTPTVPDSPAYTGPTRVGSEECVFYAEDASPGPVDFAKASPKRLSLPNTAWGSGSAAEIPIYPGAAPRGTGAAEEEEEDEEDEEDRQLAANRHSLVEKIGELVAGARALGEGQFPFPTALEETPAPPPAPAMDPPAEDMLVAIRRGVRLRRTVTNDRSAPRIS
uniref:MTSS I-BAR domain containing 2 n=1 Tax=Anser brachyrhynchus TaxID=132585 RepID=A0A8B9BDP9_9AVES